MKKNIFFLIFLMLFVVLLSGCKKSEIPDLESIRANDKVVFGVKNDTKPFGFEENGELKGIDIDIAKYIAKSLLGDEKKAEFVIVDSSNRLLILSSGKADMVIATMSITPQREAVIDFSAPYYIAGQTALVPVKSDIKTISDLNNKKVIVVFGSTAEKNLRVVAPMAHVMGAKTYPVAFEMLKSGQADAIVSDDTILTSYADNGSFRMLSKKFTREPYAIGFRKTDYSKSLQNRVNGILEEMRKTGKITEIKRKYSSNQ